MTEDHAAMNGHYVFRISKSETRYLQELNISHKSLAMNKRSLQFIETEMALLTVAKEAALRDMETFMNFAHKQLEQRRNDLRNEISDLFGRQRNALLDKQDEIRKTIKLINDNITQAKNTTQSGDVSQLKPICDSLKEANEKTQSALSHLDLGQDYLVFDTNRGYNEFTECLCTLGQAYYRGFLPIKIRFSALAIKEGHEADLHVEAYNHRGDKISVRNDYFSVWITDPKNRVIPTQLCTSGPDCTVIFTPTASGLHHVYGLFLGQKLISEQTHFSVKSDKPVLKFGAYGNGNGAFMFPRGIAIGNNGVIYVADSYNRLIQKFSSDGNFLGQFNVDRHNKDCTSVKMTLDLKNGLLYCTISVGYHHVEPSKMMIFSLDGDLQHKHNLRGISYPVSVAINSHGDLFIADRDKNCLVKVDKQGNILQCMGVFGYPADVAIADDDSIIVSDSMNDCIHVLNPDGSARQKFGSSGSGEGELSRPRGLATDGENILVADSGNNSIKIFQSDGTCVSRIESVDDPLQDPYSLAVTKDGFVFVTDSRNHCIKKYEYWEVT